MNRNRKTFHFVSLSAAAVLLFGISLNTAQAQKAGPLAEILDRLDTFVVELEALDVQTEELENPSFENKIKDAMEMKLCGHFTLPEIGFDWTIVSGELQMELGGGVGPNIMGTGLALKIEPEVTGGFGLAFAIQTDLTTETCIEIGDLADIIRGQDEAAEAGADLMLASLDTSTDPLEDFVNRLDPGARAQIVDFADQSTVYLLELLVLLLEEAGIDPIDDPDSLANILLAPVDVIGTYAMDLSPENFLDLEKAGNIVNKVSFGPGLKGAFNSSMGALTALRVEDLNPCGDIEFLPGLEGLRDQICGVESLLADIDDYLGPLERMGDSFGPAANEVESLASDIQTGVSGINSSLDSLFGDVDEVVSYVGTLSTLYTNLKAKVCQNFRNDTGCVWVVVACFKGSANINPCTASSINVSVKKCSCL